MILQTLLGLGGKLADRLLPDRLKSREQQARLNEAEVAGAPSSPLRLWRSFLGWVLSLSFAWEVLLRPLVQHYWPGADLPPSMLEDVTHLLLGLLGLGL